MKCLQFKKIVAVDILASAVLGAFTRKNFIDGVMTDLVRIAEDESVKVDHDVSKLGYYVVVESPGSDLGRYARALASARRSDASDGDHKRIEESTDETGWSPASSFYDPCSYESGSIQMSDELRKFFASMRDVIAHGYGLLDDGVTADEKDRFLLSVLGLFNSEYLSSAQISRDELSFSEFLSFSKKYLLRMTASDKTPVPHSRREAPAARAQSPPSLQMPAPQPRTTGTVSPLRTETSDRAGTVDQTVLGCEPVVVCQPKTSDRPGTIRQDCDPVDVGAPHSKWRLCCF
ncbi:hypothetical protein GNI_100380 [Gregarina niphandrodes]|uniref:Uncharacterized protein n=1 Tax=Gregarina niphandrodes TaxID=110365 RepID=A0A023B4M3_GRENI|nr:hypothetical protein GNI_100380 [Gregarina niphandrodes]EZG56862.1 hypothetical protein GNI_100380 [Gregarina niphandrodes]|eukprot:XP_011131128.1 hypothetical protein GNI_100380 [Gregarina niphandrodes]